VVLITAAGAALFLGLRRPEPSVQLVRAADDPNYEVLDIFGGLNSRTIKRHTDPPSSSLDNSPVGKAYKLIDPGRSILFYDCQKYGCGQDYLTFRSVLTLAAAAINRNNPDPDTLYKTWYDRVTEIEDQIKAFPNETYQLLAVANRIDMATWDPTSKQWKDPEIHFAYGPVPASGVTSYTVILEFVLASDPKTGGVDPTEFLNIARSWNSLSVSSTYDKDLRNTLRDSGLPYERSDKCWIRQVRVRTNFNTFGGTWRFTQMLLDPAKSAFVAALLDDQIKLPISADAFRRLWRDEEDVLLHPEKQVQIPVSLVDPSFGVSYTDPDFVLGTPPGICDAKPDARNAIALLRCTGCHTNETHNIKQNEPIQTDPQFAHIPNRDSVHNSKLSGFLVGPRNKHGAEVNFKPDLTMLYLADPSVVWTASVPYQTYSGPDGCLTAIPAAQPAASLFHDVARHTLFLAAVLADAAKNSPTGGTPSAQLLSSHSIE
jgi:hypothetical protein